MPIHLQSTLFKLHCPGWVRAWLVVLALVMVTCTVLAMGTLTGLISTSPTLKPATAKTTNQPQLRPIGRSLVTIRPFGFEPAEITRPAGPFFLEVQNRSGLPEVVLQLDREAGNRIIRENVPRKKLDWLTITDLPPGRYLLTEEQHPAWVCHITITTGKKE